VLTDIFEGGARRFQVLSPNALAVIVSETVSRATVGSIASYVGTYNVQVTHRKAANATELKAMYFSVA